MPSYSAEFKEQVVRKLMPPHNQTVAAVSRETGISEASLYNWKKQFRAKGFIVPKKSTQADEWDAKAKLTAVIQTAAMNESERSEYCRERGLYPEQIDAWREAFENADTEAPASKAELAAERKKSRALEKELRRKEKALAEAAALLTLSKKWQAIWGTNEDD